MAMARISLTEAPPTAESELTTNWPTASLSSNRTKSLLNLETKLLKREKVGGCFPKVPKLLQVRWW